MKQYRVLPNVSRSGQQTDLNARNVASHGSTASFPEKYGSELDFSIHDRSILVSFSEIATELARGLILRKNPMTLDPM
jgi:hypothetical protein